MIITESGSHWYIPTDKPPEALPYYEVPYADPSKGMRKANITDARKAGAKPSVTTVQKIENKPQIVNYQMTNLLMSSLTATRKPEESDEAFCKRVIEEADEERSGAADLGTRIHNAIEANYLMEPIEVGYAKYVALVAKLLEENGIKVERSEIPFCNKLYGGKVDAIGTINGKKCIIDWKSQKTKAGKFVFYDSWGEQLAAYSAGLGLEDAVLINVAVSTTEPIVQYKIWENDEELFMTFMLQYKLWCVRNNWDA